MLGYGNTLTHCDTLELVAQDSKGLQAAFSINITIININDNRPKLTPTKYQVSLAEYTPTSTSIITFKATDDDAGEFGEVKFLIYPIYSSLGIKYFQMDNLGNSTGTLVVRTPIDRKERKSITVKIWVQDSTGTGLGIVVEINITPGVNEIRPTFEKMFYNMEVRSDAPVGASVGQVTATDVDRGMSFIFINYMRWYHHGQ